MARAHHRATPAWLRILKGLGMALGVTVAGVAVFALLMQWIRPSESAVRIFNQVLKLAFPLNIHTNDATFEIQFGHVHRPTHRNTSWDAARFEVCAQKWVDVSETGYGAALLNDCKYGHSVEGSTLELTVLKAGTYPQPADLGVHQFSYSLLPHGGSIYEADVIRQAYSFNQPLSAVAVDANAAGTLADTFSFISTDLNNIVIDTVKQCEDSDDMLVRLHDTFNCKTTPTITFGVPVKAVAVADLMENTLYDLAVENNTVKLPVKNFEIVTLKVTPA